MGTSLFIFYTQSPVIELKQQQQNTNSLWIFMISYLFSFASNFSNTNTYVGHHLVQI